MQSGYEINDIVDHFTRDRATRLLRMIAEQIIDIPVDEMTTAERNILNVLWASSVVNELPLTTKAN
jgi:hypothetical protein